MQNPVKDHLGLEVLETVKQQPKPFIYLRNKLRFTRPVSASETYPLFQKSQEINSIVRHPILCTFADHQNNVNFLFSSGSLESSFKVTSVVVIIVIIKLLSFIDLLHVN